MPQEPKKRHSRQRKGKRRASIKLKKLKFVECPNCKSVILTHIVCKKCGFYEGKQILTINAAKTNPQASLGASTGPKTDGGK